MSDSNESSGPSGGGSKHADVSVDLDPKAIEDLFSSSSADQAAKDTAKKATVKHELSIDVSGMTWGQVKDKYGTTTFLPEVKAALTPAQSGSSLEADLHTTLVERHWADIDGIGLKTVLGGDLKYADDKVGGDLEVKQDFTFKQATLEATVTTDFATGKVTATGGIKFSF